MELRLALRYFHSRRKHPFINLIKNISILGIALGVGALIVVLAVMNGFEHDLREKTVGAFAHAVIEADGPVFFTPRFEEEVRALAESVRYVSPYVQGEALIQNDKQLEGILLKGARGEVEQNVTDIMKNMTDGTYPAEAAHEVLLGNILAGILRVKTGDPVMLISSHTKKPVPFRVSGIFHTGMYEYDAHWVYGPFKAAQELFGMGEGASGVGIRFAKLEDAPREKQALQLGLGFPFYVRTWADMNRNLFNALKLEKTVMFIILTLITLVACFNIVGTLTLLVIDKTKDIGILKAMGASDGSILRIFTYCGLCIGVSGILLGLGIGLGACALLGRYSLIDIPSDIYYFGKLPVMMDWADVVVILTSALFLSFLSTLYPAYAGSRLKPVEALRFE